ncbi:MAG: M48 family peptidase [Bacteroidetes bacterium]|nr:MAG: M48 family peptidase [Bacteroidota bacterium]
MEQIIFYLILGFVIFDYVLEQILNYLNSTKRSEKIPDEIKGIYDEKKYRKQQNYEKETSRFSFITSTFSFVIILLMLIFNGFYIIDSWVIQITENYILKALLFFGVIMFTSDLINLPFSVYSVFVIEEKYGFNKTTVKTFILDKIKSWLLTAIIGGGILSFIIWVYMQTQQMFWIYVWIAISVFTVFFTMFYSSIIVPLFNKQTPLEDGELKTAIIDFSKKVGFKLDNIYKIDGSKRSTKANAYFSGLGPKKRIVLYDTLINDLEVNELVAVLAHEIGHYKKKHVLKNIFFSILQTGVILYILSLFIGNPILSKALGSPVYSFEINLIAFSLLYSPISMITGVFMNIYSRKNEYQADEFAKNNYDGKALASALKKLSVNNLSNLTPHKLYVFFNYSHPTLLERLQALKK